MSASMGFATNDRGGRGFIRFAKKGDLPMSVRYGVNGLPSLGARMVASPKQQNRQRPVDVGDLRR